MVGSTLVLPIMWPVKWWALCSDLSHTGVIMLLPGDWWISGVDHFIYNAVFTTKWWLTAALSEPNHQALFAVRPSNEYWEPTNDYWRPSNDYWRHGNIYWRPSYNVLVFGEKIGRPKHCLALPKVIRTTRKHQYCSLYFMWSHSCSTARARNKNPFCGLQYRDCNNTFKLCL